jgi:hypothetical protein
VKNEHSVILAIDRETKRFIIYRYMTSSWVVVNLGSAVECWVNDSVGSVAHASKAYVDLLLVVRAIQVECRHH